MEHYVYILYSPGIDKYYVGKSANPTERLKFHNSDLNKIWTRRGKPWIAKRILRFENSTLASKAEYYIKRKKSRAYLEKIICHGWLDPDDFE